MNEWMVRSTMTTRSIFLLTRFRKTDSVFILSLADGKMKTLRAGMRVHVCMRARSKYAVVVRLGVPAGLGGLSKNMKKREQLFRYFSFLNCYYQKTFSFFDPV